MPFKGSSKFLYLFFPTRFSKLIRLGLMLFLIFQIGLANVFAQTIQTFTTSGTFTVPPGVSSITVETWGAGGRGTSLTNIDRRGNGGGGGAYSRSTFSVTSGNTYFYSVGSGSNSDLAGGDSWLNITNSASGAIILAKGGTSASDN
jgi:hypothetical protein